MLRLYWCTLYVHLFVYYLPHNKWILKHNITHENFRRGLCTLILSLKYHLFCYNIRWTNNFCTFETWIKVNLQMLICWSCIQHKKHLTLFFSWYRRYVSLVLLQSITQTLEDSLTLAAEDTCYLLVGVLIFNWGILIGVLCYTLLSGIPTRKYHNPSHRPGLRCNVIVCFDLLHNLKFVRG